MIRDPDGRLKDSIGSGEAAGGVSPPAKGGETEPL